MSKVIAIFRLCTALATAPSLRSQNLTFSCCRSLFFARFPLILMPTACARRFGSVSARFTDLCCPKVHFPADLHPLWRLVGRGVFEGLGMVLCFSVQPGHVPNLIVLKYWAWIPSRSRVIACQSEVRAFFQAGIWLTFWPAVFMFAALFLCR